MPGAYLSTAPGRAGIIGNPTDMYGGSVISCSTRERAAVLIEPADVLSFEVADCRRVIQPSDELKPEGGYFRRCDGRRRLPQSQERPISPCAGRATSPSVPVFQVRPP